MNNIKIYLKGKEINFTSLSNDNFFNGAKVLVEKNKEIIIGSKKVRRQNFDIICKDLPYDGDSEMALWNLRNNLIARSELLKQANVNSITILLQIKNLDNSDFSITKEFFTIGKRLKILLKCSFEVVQPSTETNSPITYVIVQDKTGRGKENKNLSNSVQSSKAARVEVSAIIKEGGTILAKASTGKSVSKKTALILKGKRRITKK